MNGEAVTASGIFKINALKLFIAVDTGMLSSVVWSMEHIVGAFRAHPLILDRFIPFVAGTTETIALFFRGGHRSPCT